MNEDKKICGYDVCPEVGEHEKCPMNPKNRIKNPDYQEGFLAGQKQERERIKNELSKILAFNKDVNDIFSEPKS